MILRTEISRQKHPAFAPRKQANGDMHLVLASCLEGTGVFKEALTYSDLQLRRVPGAFITSPGGSCLTASKP